MSSLLWLLAWGVLGTLLLRMSATQHYVAPRSFRRRDDRIQLPAELQARLDEWTRDLEALGYRWIGDFVGETVQRDGLTISHVHNRRCWLSLDQRIHASATGIRTRRSDGKSENHIVLVLCSSLGDGTELGSANVELSNKPLNYACLPGVDAATLHQAHLGQLRQDTRAYDEGEIVASVLRPKPVPPTPPVRVPIVHRFRLLFGLSEPWEVLRWILLLTPALSATLAAAALTVFRNDPVGLTVASAACGFVAALPFKHSLPLAFPALVTMPAELLLNAYGHTGRLPWVVAMLVFVIVVIVRLARRGS